MRRKQLVFHATSLFIGSLIYILFRCDTLTMFCWLDTLMLMDFISSIRESTMQFKNVLPAWFLYSLPDGLWVFSYVCLMLAIWGRPPDLKNLFWYGLIPFYGIFNELCQLVAICTGTFDLVDLSFYLLGFVLPFFIFSDNHKPKTYVT